MTMKSKILRYSIGPVGSALIALATLPIIAWFYTINDVAKFSIFQAIILLYTLVFSFGLDQAFIREYYSENNKNSLLYNVLLSALLPSILFITVVFLFFSENLSYLIYDEYSYNLTLFTLLSCFLSLLIRFLSSIQRVNDQALLFSLSQIIPKFIFLVLVIFFTYFLPKKFINIVVAQFLGLLVVAVYFLVINRKYILNAYSENFNKVATKSYLIYGFPLIFTGIFIWGLKVSDRFYLKFLSNLEQLGLYSMAVSIAGAVGVFVSVFNTIWSPLVYKWVSEKDIYDSEIKSKVESIALKGSFIILLITVLSIVGSYLVPYFLPSAYAKIYLILPLGVLSILLYTLSEVTGIGINLMKKTQYTLLSCFIAIIFHIILSLVLIPKFGAIGAALAGGISFYIFSIVRSYFSNKIWVNLNLLKVRVIIFLSFIISVFPVIFSW